MSGYKAGDGLGNFATIFDSNNNATNISKSAYDSMMDSGGFDSTGFTVGQPGTAGNSIFGMDTGVLDLGLGIGQLGLGYLAYKDNKRMNDAKLEGMQQNLDNAKTEAAATANYRKSYGA